MLSCVDTQKPARSVTAGDEEFSVADQLVPTEEDSPEGEGERCARYKYPTVNKNSRLT